MWLGPTNLAAAPAVSCSHLPDRSSQSVNGAGAAAVVREQMQLAISSQVQLHTFGLLGSRAGCAPRPFCHSLKGGDAQPSHEKCVLFVSTTEVGARMSWRRSTGPVASSSRSVLIMTP